jgi:RNA 3'-terminal phosphate cyclase (ATP)
VIDLDSSDGGGQLVRTALSLSAVRGVPFRMERVRGDRPNPGLKRQHLACVEAVAALTDADVEGAAVGSETLRFEPTVRPGAATAPDEVAVDVGTAGSVTLVADTLLPLATRIDGPVRADLTGGTDVRWSPSTDYLRRVKLPLLRSFGLDADVGVDRRGFYPAGGGTLDLRLRPSSLDPIELGTRDAPLSLLV